MKFLELMEKVKARGVRIVELDSAENPEIVRVCEDSRKVTAGDLFVARGGTKRDGAEFVEAAIARGAVAVVVKGGEAGDNLDVWEAVPETVACAEVEDVNLACALLAHEAAGNPTTAGGGMKMIGVTGTKGKTTVAYLMRSVLKAAGHKVGMIGTVEIDDGAKAEPAEMTTPGAVELVEMFCRMRENGVTHCVMEVSSHALHQKRVTGIDFAVAIFTNLTGDHLDYHKTMEEYAAAKAILFEELPPGSFAVVNFDDPYAERVVRGCKAKVLSYGLSNKCDWRATILSTSSFGSRLSIDGPDGLQAKMVPIPLVGRHNVYNTLSVIVATCSLAIPGRKVLAGIHALRGVPGRLQEVAWQKKIDEIHPFVFVDYAHTHDSLENVLRALRETMKRSKLICVFGCGGDRDRTKRPKMGAVAEKLADWVIVTSDNPRTEDAGKIIEEICAGFSEGWREAGKIAVEPDRRAAIRMAISMADSGDVVLLAGKGHENYQIIGTTKHHFDDVEEAQRALDERFR